MGQSSRFLTCATAFLGIRRIAYSDFCCGIGGSSANQRKIQISLSMAAKEEHLISLGLTAREAEVLRWIAEGKSNHDIGVILGASTRTIHKHVEHIFSKLSVENRTAAATIALAVVYQLTDLL